MPVYICRHGDRETLHLHSRLSTLGMEQTRGLGRVLAQQDIICPFIVSSVYDRCLETAVQISLELGSVPIRVEHGLSEGPVSRVQVFNTNKFSKHEYPLLDDSYSSHTPPPEAEYDHHDVFPRCARMAEYIFSLCTALSRTLACTWHSALLVACTWNSALLVLMQQCLIDPL